MDINELKKQIVDYWNRQPCWSNRSNEEFMSNDYFNETEKKRPVVNDPYGLKEKFIDFKNTKDKKVLEIGCGTGLDAIKFIQNKSIYTGIDISENSVKIAKKRIARISNKNCFFVGDAANQNFLSQFTNIDLVYSNGVLHHCPEIDSIIANVSNILNDDGEFIFMVYAKDSYKHALVKEGLARYESQDNCPYVQLYSLDEIKEFLFPYFEVVDSMRGGLFMYNIEEYKKNNLVLEPWFAVMDEKIKLALYKNLGEWFFIKAKKSKI